jgi:hypothetical protein
MVPTPQMFTVLLNRVGTAVMVRVAVVLALFVAAHLVRWPLLLAARVLTAAMCRADAYLTRCLSPPGSCPAAGRRPVAVTRIQGGVR